MTLSPNGTLFVGTRKEGKVYALLDRNHANVADEVITLAHGLNMPNGVAFHDGALYVAEVHRILRYDNIEARLTTPPQPVVVNDSYPRDTHHGWKFIRLGPDGMLYVPVGAPCNICQRADPRYASITRLKLDGTGFAVVAHGVRNEASYQLHHRGLLYYLEFGARLQVSLHRGRIPLRLRQRIGKPGAAVTYIDANRDAQFTRNTRARLNRQPKQQLKLTRCVAFNQTRQ